MPTLKWKGPGDDNRKAISLQELQEEVIANKTGKYRIVGVRIADIEPRAFNKAGGGRLYVAFVNGVPVFCVLVELMDPITEMKYTVFSWNAVESLFGFSAEAFEKMSDPQKIEAVENIDNQSYYDVDINVDSKVYENRGVVGSSPKIVRFKKQIEKTMTEESKKGKQKQTGETQREGAAAAAVETEEEEEERDEETSGSDGKNEGGGGGGGGEPGGGGGEGEGGPGGEERRKSKKKKMGK